MNFEVKPTKETDWTTKFSNIVLPTASILTLFIATISNYSSLPGWFIYLPILMLVGWAIFFIGNNSGGILIRRKKKTIARSHFPTLITLAGKFGDLICSSTNDTITYALRALNQQDQHLQNKGFSDLCEWMTANLNRRLRDSDHSFRELKLGIEDLRALIHSYHRLYFFDTVDKLRTISTVTLTDDNKKIIEVSRESFIRYIEQFQNLYENINQTLKIKEFNYYFEKAKPL